MKHTRPIRTEQHYAVSKDNKLFHIKTAHLSTETFYCPHCKSKMIKKCGAIRAWHFAHDFHHEDIDKECSYESYLHAYAKLRIKEWIEDSPQIILKYASKLSCEHHGSCCWEDNNDKCFKTKLVETVILPSETKCILEKNIEKDGDKFRADILLETHPDNILIEINVNHFCSDKKIKSGLKIIEIDINSEVDIENIVAQNYLKEGSNIHFYGFDKIDPKYDSKFNLVKFFIFRSNKSCYDFINCKLDKNHKRSSILEISLKQPINDSLVNISCPYHQKNKSIFVSGWAYAVKNNIANRNCYICTHYNKCENRDNDDKSFVATKCPNYKADEYTINQKYNEFASYIQHNITNIWIPDKSAE